MAPSRGDVDLRCFYGAPWRIDQDRAQPGEIPYHVGLGGSAVLDDGTGGPPKRLVAREIVLLPHSGAMSCMTAMVRRRLPGPAWRIDRPGAPRLSESPDRGSVVRWCMAGSCGLTVGANHLRRHGERCSRGDRPQPERGSSRRAAYLPDEKGAAAVKKGESSACAARQPATPVARPSSSKPATATTARRNRR